MENKMMIIRRNLYLVTAQTMIKYLIIETFVILHPKQPTLIMSAFYLTVRVSSSPGFCSLSGIKKKRV